MTFLRNDINDYPVTIGASVERVEGRPENVGRRGIVSAIHGTVAGDTLITVNGGTAAEWQAYTRQVQVNS